MTYNSDTESNYTTAFSRYVTSTTDYMEPPGKIILKNTF